MSAKTENATNATEARTCKGCGAALEATHLYCPACGLANGERRRRFPSGWGRAERSQQAEEGSPEPAGNAAAPKASRRRKPSKKQLEAEARRKAGDEPAMSTGDLVGFLRMYEDGLAETAPGLFSRTCEFRDLSYEHERKDVKDEIYERWSQVHSSFSPGWCYQINLVNIPLVGRHERRYLPETGANADYARAFNDILTERQRKGRIEFERRNLLTFSTVAADAASADRTLKTQMGALGPLFARLGSSVEPLTGVERARIEHQLLNGPEAPFVLDYKSLVRSKTRAREYVAPAWAAYEASDKLMRSRMVLPNRVVKVLQIKDFGSDLSDNAIRSIRALPIPMNVSLLFRPQPRGETIQRVRTNINVAQAAINEYAQSIAKSGGDPTRLPPALEEKEDEARDLLDHIRDDDQSIAWFQGMIAIYAEDGERLAVYEQMVRDEAAVWTLDVAEMPLQQEQAIASSMPLARPILANRYRSLSTAESAAMVPFASQNIHDDPASSLLLGTDTVSGDDILVNPDRLKSPHSWVFGITGAGKGMQMNTIVSYSLLQHPRTQRDELTGKWVNPDPCCPQWHVFDFHGEYVKLAEDFGAAIGTFGPGREDAINPLGISDAAGELTQKVVVENIDFFIAMTESVLGVELTGTEKGVLDECLTQTYAPYIGSSSRPTLTELYERLRAYGEDKETEAKASAAVHAARALADAWRIYATGSMSSFARETTFSPSPQLNVYNMSEVGSQMQTIAMLSALQFVRSCTFKNHRIGKPTYLVLEEVQTLFDNASAVSILDKYFAELRKFGLHIICVTQLPERVLKHERATYLFQNSGLFVFLPMSERDSATIATMFKLSATQHDLIKQSADPGTGLVVADGVKISMSNRIPKDNPLYEVWNTDPYKNAKSKRG